MKTWLRRLRGALGTGLVWAVGWCGAGLIAGTTGLLGQLAPFEYVVFGVSFAIAGFASGVLFSASLSLAERKRRFDQLSLPRFGAWGALGGAGMSMAMFAVGGAGVGWLTTIGFFMILGGASSMGSLALARRAERRDLLEFSQELDMVGLTPEESRELLG